MTIYEQIEAAKERLAAFPNLSKSSFARLDEDFAILFTYNSNAIEGSTLSERETYLLIKEGISPKDKPFQYQADAMGHMQAYNHVRGLAEKQCPMTEERIREIHRFVLMRDPAEGGNYRVVDVHIAGSDVLLTGAEQVLEAMQHLLARHEQRKQTENILDCIAKFHLEFEQVHPFIDGNGRTGRLLLNYELMLNGYPPIDIKNQDKARYYYCFEAFQGRDENDFPMKRLICEYVLAALEERIRIAEQAKSILESREQSR